MPEYQMLPRRGLTEKILHTAKEHPLTVVVAPMGYGKTTLALSVAEAAGADCFYYAVPTGPHDASFLWHDLSCAFNAQGLDIAPAMLRLGFPEAPLQWRHALDLLRGIQTQTYLILDDCQLITDPAMFVFLERIVRERIPNVRLLLFSRTRPDIALEELCLKGYATAFAQSVLAFSESETREYFQMHGVSDADAVAKAHAYSEGWPAVLWLCLQNWLTYGNMSVARDMDSLLAAVFAGYESEEQTALMRLSVLESFTDNDMSRLAAVAYTAADLRALRGRNPFLVFDMKTGRYQFHALFRDFLRKELARATHIDKTALYRLAGECCAERHDLVGALRLFNRAGRDEDLVRLLDTFLSFEDDPSVVYFVEERFAAASATPWHVRFQNPFGWLAAVGYVSLMWNDHRTAHLLDEAEEHFRTAPDIPEYLKKRIQGEIEVLRASLAFNDTEKILEHFTEASRLLKGPSIFSSQDSVWNYSSPSLAFILLREAGEYAELMEKEKRVVRLYHALSGGLEKGGWKVFQAENLLERGHCGEAVPLLYEALRQCGDDSRYLAAILPGAFTLARVHIATGGPEKAFQALRKIRPLVDRIQVSDHCECLDMAEGYLYGVLGNLNAMPQWLRNGDVFDPPHCAIPQVFGFSLTVHGKALLLQGKYDPLATVAEEIPRAAPIKSLHAHIHSKALQAIAAWHLRSRGAALQSMRAALELSRPDGLILSLAEYGRHVIPLLRQIKRETPEDTHLEAVLNLAGRIALVTSPRRKGGGDLLTPREKELLRHVAQGKSNLAIAESLSVSGNTVKVTLSRIYAKLGVGNRTEAVQRFAQMQREADG